MPKTKKNFEEALAALEASVEKMDEKELSLDEMLANYEAGIKAWKICHEALEKAEGKIEVLQQEFSDEQ